MTTSVLVALAIKTKTRNCQPSRSPELRNKHRHASSGSHDMKDRSQKSAIGRPICGSRVIDYFDKLITQRLFDRLGVFGIIVSALFKTRPSLTFEDYEEQGDVVRRADQKKDRHSMVNM